MIHTHVFRCDYRVNNKATMEVGGLGQRADQITQRRLRSYRGCALVELRHLMFEGEEVLGSRPLDPKNVDRLAKIYELEGCQQLEPEHRVAALIKEDILYQTIEQCNIIPNALFDYANPPTLSFNQNVRLLCLYGKHRLKAAEIHAVASWLVDLYLDGEYDSQVVWHIITTVISLILIK